MSERENNTCVKSVFITLLFFTSQIFLGQFYNLPNEYGFALLTEKSLARKDSSVHSGLKPYIVNSDPKYLHIPDSSRIFRFISGDPLIDFLFYEHAISVKPKNENFSVRFDPLVNFEGGGDVSRSTNRRTYTNTRGFIGSGNVGDYFYFETLFAENQSVFPSYIANHAKTSQVVPGQGRWKQFKSNGFDYAFSSGFISVKLAAATHLQLGHGKHKVGHGYRSLLLSDNAFNFPYLKLSQGFWKGRIQYHIIFASLMNLVSASEKVNPNVERLFQKKPASFHYVSINPFKSLNVGFFQGMIREAGNKRNKHNLDWRYFNPVIFSNALTYGLDHKHNVVAGLDLQYKITNKINVYGQVMLDSFAKDSLNGMGYQAGFNIFDLFGFRNLFFQAEYNNVNEGAYNTPRGIKTDQSYTHYNDLLGYTPGEGRELLFVLDKKIKRFYYHFRYHIQYHHESKSTANTVNVLNARIGYVINPAYNLNISIGMLNRTQNFSNFKGSNNEANYIYLAFRTSLYNFYYDF